MRSQAMRDGFWGLLFAHAIILQRAAMRYTRVPLRSNVYRVLLTGVLLSLLAASCVVFGGPKLTPTPLPTSIITQTATPSPTSSPTTAGTQPVWDGFPGPSLTPPTPIPPPLSGLHIDEDTQIAMLVGMDRELPFNGRAIAIHIVIYNPRLAKASLVAVPMDLFVYLPGFGMQRINAAYAIGGVQMLAQTIAYNFGLRPTHWAVAHPSDFMRLVDELGGIQVPVLIPMPYDCGNLPAGNISMNGQLAFCYGRAQDPIDPFDVLRRQQDLIQAIFWRLVRGGVLVRLPDLFDALAPGMDTNVTLGELADAVPLALKLGDPGRLGFFTIGPDQVDVWQLSPQAQVFVPRRVEVKALIQQALDAAQSPAPLSEIVQTLEYELTISPTPTDTPIPTNTPTATDTMRPTETSTPTTSATPTFTTTLTPSPTATFTVTPSSTPSPTEEATATATP